MQWFSVLYDYFYENNMDTKYLIIPFTIWLLVTTVILFYIGFSLNGFHKKIDEVEKTSQRIEEKVNSIYSILDINSSCENIPNQ